MKLRKAKPETQTQLLHRRYNAAMIALSDFQTTAAFMSHNDSPISYGDLCKQIDKLKTDFQANVYDVLPSAKIIKR